jgi:uncharacterized membrane protein
MGQLILGLVLFFGMHSVSIVALPLRDRLAAKSELGWKALYAIVSLIGIVLVVRGYAELRLAPTVLYDSPVWLRHLAAVFLLPVFALFLAPYFPGRIASATRNPQLVATKLWAVAHLLVNGTVADVLLFGSFLVWAVADSISMKNRPARPVPGAPASAANDILLVVIGLALYAAMIFWLHEVAFGVRPFV